MIGNWKLLGLLTGAAAVLASQPAIAADWSTTELQYQFGKLDNPFAGTKNDTSILTFQHASGYNWGDIFFFIDMLDDDKKDGFNDKEAYTEFYAFFSSAKILKRTYSGPIKDVGLMAGINYDADAGFRSYLPGAYVDWNVPGFSFVRTYFAAMVDDSDIAQKDGFQADLSWALPFQIAGQRFSVEGHMEYTTLSENIFGPQKDWFLFQPQLRWDVGYALTGRKDQFFVGTEYQLFVNKLGTDDDESTFQALGVWRF